jgi:arylsulfatase A-like enzyme
MMIAILPLAAPASGWAKATSKFRLRKTEPVILALATDVRLGFDDLSAPPDFPVLAAAWQSRWLAESNDKSWRFADPRRPYVRIPIGTAPPAETRPWNLIYLQLESFRGVDMGFLGKASPSPTPFLDRLAASPGAAVWTRASSFGMPTINGIFATHCSAAPHSRRFISSFTPTAMYCLPEALRRRGYRTEMFNAGDTDWDNSTIWLTRWYDRLWRFPEAKQQDRPVFRAAAGRIRALGRSGRPFFAAIVSVSNHTPFTTREKGFDIAGQATPSERILNTTRYTDDVVRELIEALRHEPWFEHTILVIVGDHGFNLGEHDVPSGQVSLYRESLWVPLLIVGRHPRLPAGRHGESATLLDVAPTLADLVGLREPVPWQGHSLIGGGRDRLFAFAIQSWRLGESGSWSAVDEPGREHPRLFDRRLDWRQTRDRSRDHAAIAAALAGKAEQNRRLNDYLLRHDLIWRRPDS